MVPPGPNRVKKCTNEYGIEERRTKECVINFGQTTLNSQN